MISEAKYQTLEKSLIIKIQDILSQAVKGRKYDCIVSVSGGKDSYYQVHYVKNVLGLKPLLVTYNGNNYSEIGWKNLWNMRDVFDCDHIVVSPSVKTIKKLNKLAFIAMGDMNWHAHIEFLLQLQELRYNKKYHLYFGKHGYADLCGQFSMSDFEMNYRKEQNMRTVDLIGTFLKD